MKILADTDLEADFVATVGQKAAFGVSLAFHLRPIEGRNTFEFLHKTFAEYLVACRFADDMSEIVDEMMGNGTRYRKRGDVSSILRRWLATWGARAIDADVLRFIRDEIARRRQIDGNGKTIIASAAIHAFVDLMRRAISDGMPAHEMKGEERAGRKVESFSDMVDWARNAEEALLVALNAAILSRAQAANTGYEAGKQFQREEASDPYPEAISINPALENPFVMGDMMHRLDRQPGHDFVWMYCLAGLELSDARLFRAPLQEAQLQGARLQRADLRWADFFRANLRGANLSEAVLHGASLGEADLQGANLQGANLQMANLRGADLGEADLRGAGLQGANLRLANLQRASLSGNSSLSEVRGLSQTRHLDEAHLLPGWSVTWNEAGRAWDITTPDGPYSDADEGPH